MSGKRGLGEEWDSVQNVLNQIVDVYDKVNRIISLGKDISYRRDGIRRGIKEGDLILDAGCGPGVMSEVILKEYREPRIVLLDPINLMLKAAQKRLGNELPLVSGVFEVLPFQDSTFDAVMCGYSIRDANQLEKALREIARILKPEGGRLVIVDLGKPDNMLLRWTVGIYWHYIVPVLAVLRIGKRGLLYSALYRTYRRHPTNKEFREMISSLFKEIRFETRTLGASAIITAKR